MDKQMKEKVFEVLSRITGRSYQQVDMEADLAAQISLDSIQMVDFFAALEMEFGIELPLKMMNAKTGIDFMAMLEVELKYTLPVK